MMKQLILFTSVVLFLLLAGFSGLAQSSDNAQQLEVVVEPGDTLWQLANEHYDDSRDIRVVVAEIKAYNELDDVTIQPGEKLLLPQ